MIGWIKPIQFISDVGVGGGGVDPAAILAALQSELVGAGIWSKLDALYISSGQGAAGAVVNIKTPGTFDLTPIGGPAFSRAGFAGDGVDAYLSTGYTPDGSRNYKLNDASVGVWVKQQPVTSSADYVGGAASLDRLRIGARTSAAAGSTTRLNNATSNSVYTIRAQGLTALRRSNSTGYQVFKDGILAGSVTSASTGLPGEITFLRLGAVYSPSTTIVCAEWIGGSLTDAEMVAIHTAVGRCLSSLGAITQDEYQYPGGVTTWFNEPRSVAVDGAVVVGGVAVDGSVVANTIVSGEAGLQAMLFKNLERDDHDNPALLRRVSDGRLLALYSRHSEDDSLFFQLGSIADSGLAWGASTDIGTALGGTRYGYAQAVQLTGETDDPIHLFTRCVTGADPNTLHHAVMDEAGAVTSTVERVLTGTRPYFKVVQNGTARIDIWCNDGHPAEVSTNSLYHFYYEAGGWFDSAGGSLGAVPFVPSSDLARIWDGGTAAGRSWVWSGEIVGGSPSVAYAVFPSASDHRYRCATWNGSAWVDEEVCAAGGYLYAGEPYYSGGIALDPENAGIVYCCRQVDSSGVISTSGVHQLFKFVKSGGTWTGTQLTFGTDPCLRPYVIPGTRLLQYCTGQYTTFTNYDTRIVVVSI